MFSIWGLLRESTEEGGWRGWKEEEKPRQTDRRGGQERAERETREVKIGREGEREGTKGIREGPLTRSGQQGPCLLEE